MKRFIYTHKLTNSMERIVCKTCGSISKISSEEIELFFKKENGELKKATCTKCGGKGEWNG